MKQKLLNVLIFILLGLIWVRLDHRIMDLKRDITRIDRFLEFVEVEEIK